MKIFIDAGHNDSKWNIGAAGNGLREQDITYDISKILANKLQEAGIQVKLSRENKTDILGTDNSTSLSARAKMANAWDADLFISIHCNSASSASASGTEVFTYSTSSKSYALAQKICQGICNKLKTKNRGTKTANFAVLRQTSMPAILIETAFISNALDASLLKNKQDDFASAICNEVCSYYGIQQGKKETTATNQAESFKYTIDGTTHVIEVDPRNIFAVETQCPTNKTSYNNFVNSIFFMNLAGGKVHPQGIVVNAGKVIANNPTHGKPVATLIVRDKDTVEMKYVSDITKEGNVWFAVSGYGIYPTVTATSEGFTGKFSDVTRSTNRPIIGYRKKDNKIVIAVRANTDAARANQTAKNLGLDFAISLDGGGSTTLKVNGNYKFKGDGRTIFGGIIWA